MREAELGSRRWALMDGAMGGALVSCERARMRRGRRRGDAGVDGALRRGTEEACGVGNCGDEVGFVGRFDERPDYELRASAGVPRPWADLTFPNTEQHHLQS